MTIQASDLIRQAYVLAQVWDPGEEQPGAEAQEGLLTLNTLIAEWASMGTYIPNYSTLTIELEAGDYLTEVTPPITEILNAHINNDTTCQTILREANLQEFNTFNFENIQSRPNRIYFAAKPGEIDTKTNVYFWPPASGDFTATVYVKQIISQFTYSADITNLPLNYFKALKYQLAKDLADIYVTTLSERFDREYEKVIANLKTVNKKDLSVQVANPYQGNRRFRPWNIYAG